MNDTAYQPGLVVRTLTWHWRSGYLGRRVFVFCGAVGMVGLGVPMTILFWGWEGFVYLGGAAVMLVASGAGVLRELRERQ